MVLGWARLPPQAPTRYACRKDVPMWYVHEPVWPEDDTAHCHVDSLVTGGPPRCHPPYYQAHLVWASLHTCVCWRMCQAHLGWGLLFMGAESQGDLPYNITVEPMP